MAWEGGASMAAFATRGTESTSPTPVMPSSVWMRTMSVSCVPSALEASTSGSLRYTASTSVIFMRSGILSIVARSAKRQYHALFNQDDRRVFLQQLIESQTVSHQVRPASLLRFLGRQPIERIDPIFFKIS